MTGYQELDLRWAAAAAIRAPSLHNSQPWRFRLRDGGIEVLADQSRQLAVADSRGWAVRIACGAATLNARLAFAVNGAPAQVVLRPDGTEPDLMARLTPGSDRPPHTLNGICSRRSRAGTATGSRSGRTRCRRRSASG